MLTCPRNRKLMKRNTSRISSDGVRKFPMRLTSLPGVMHSHSAIRKNTSEYTTIHTRMFASCGRYGATAISNGTDAARGMPSPGPIDR